MRIKGSNAVADARRARGLALLSEGKTCAQAASQVGVSIRTVQRWRQEERTGGRRERRKAGRACWLTSRQLQQLERALKRGAVAQGYAEDYWTLDRVAQVIWTRFGVRYHPSGVWRLLRRMGWSCQKPQRQALSRDDEAIAHWKRYQWPRIKKVP
jgi:transposase